MLDRRRVLVAFAGRSRACPGLKQNSCSFSEKTYAFFRRVVVQVYVTAFYRQLSILFMPPSIRLNSHVFSSTENVVG